MDMKQVEQEIARLEAMPTSYPVVQRLACLYAVRKESKPTAVETSLAKETLSEFRSACTGKSVEDILAVMDERLKLYLSFVPGAMIV